VGIFPSIPSFSGTSLVFSTRFFESKHYSFLSIYIDSNPNSVQYVFNSVFGHSFINRLHSDMLILVSRERFWSVRVQPLDTLKLMQTLQNIFLPLNKVHEKPSFHLFKIWRLIKLFSSQSLKLSSLYTCTHFFLFRKNLCNNVHLSSLWV